MSPEERQMIAGLFDRVRDAERQPRDRDAEAYIATRAQEAPNAPYTLAQVVLVQEQALGAAQRRIAELEGQLQEAQDQKAQDEARSAPPPQQGGFLGSLFGGSRPAPERAPPQRFAPQGGQGGSPFGQRSQPFGQQQGGPGFASQQDGPQGGPQGGPWSRAQPAQQGGGGGGFLTGALTTAAGVAGGMLLANSIQGLFKSDPALAKTAGADPAAAATPAASQEALPASSQETAGQDSGGYDNNFQDAGYDAGGFDDSSFDDGSFDL